MDTDFEYTADISWDGDLQQDVVMVDTGDDTFYLTAKDLKELSHMLDEYEDADE